MASSWSIPEPNAAGCYSKTLNPAYEQFMIKRIQQEVSVVIDSTTAGGFLLQILTEAKQTALPRSPIQPLTLEKCNEYVRQRPEMVLLLNNVHLAGAYAWLCEQLALTTQPNAVPSSPHPSPLPVLKDSPVSDDWDSTALSESLAKFEQILRPKIRVFLRQPNLPIWIPPGFIDKATQEFYRNLGIPKLNQRPSLLLHDLGTTPNDRVDELFRKDIASILCNTSGAGKTRLLFEGLCRHWGFYFVAAQDTHRIGSPDLELMIDRMSCSKEWVPAIFDDNGILLPNRNNDGIALNRISRVLLARRVVFKIFIETAKELYGDLMHPNIKRDWLHFQIHSPVRIGDMDPFTDCINQCLLGLGQNSIDSWFNNVAIADILGPAFSSQTDTFFLVLDEAQVAGKHHQGAFSDADGKELRPVLRPIIQAIHAYHNAWYFQYIVSGTGFSLSLFQQLLTSGLTKLVEWRTFHAVGDFIDKERQKAYTARYLPPLFLLSASGKALVERMYEWLRGRHRFTTSFLEELIARSWITNFPVSPHRLLNAYVYRLCDFTPLDGDNELLKQEPDVERVDILQFPWNKIAQEPDLLKVLSHSIYTFITRGKYPMWYYEHAALVEYGIARFRGHDIMVEEPLALISIVRYFETHALTLDANIRARLQDDKGTAFEELVLFAVTKLLREQQVLSRIFEFHDPVQDWAGCTAQIVARSSSGNFREFDLVDEQPVLPNNGIVFYAENPEDVKFWLEKGEAGWCVPGRLMGPDLTTRLRLSDGRLLLLVIQAKCRLTGNVDTVDAEVTASAIQSLIPSKFFASLQKSNLSVASAQQIQGRIAAMLAAISMPHDGFTTGPYNILRVVAAFPLTAEFDSRSALVKRVLQADNHALALLPRSALASALATRPNGSSILSMLVKTLERTRGKVEEV